MSADPLFWALAVLGVLMAGISKAGFASGATFLAVPMLAIVVEPAKALALMLPLLMLMDVAGVGAYWRRWSARDAWLLCLGAIPGIVLAAALHRVAPPDLIRGLIGAIAVAFVMYQIARERRWLPERERPWPRAVGAFAGCMAGFTSFVSHAGGPPVLIYLLAQGLQKTAFQATTVVTFWAINLAKAGPYVALGFFDRSILMTAAVLAPVALFGTWLGVRAHGVIPERLFFGVTAVLLAAAGIKLIVDALL